MRWPTWASAALGPATRSCADLAAELGCPAEALERLLDCAVAQKLLVCEASRYGNRTERALPDRGQSRVAAQLDPHHGPLEAALGTAGRGGAAGAAVDNQAKWLGEDPQFMRDFILGMHPPRVPDRNSPRR